MGGCCTTDLLPVFFSGILLISVSVSFVIAVAESDIAPWFPAISDTATKTPESNVFSQLVNISTFLGFVLLYVRYLQIRRDVAHLMGGRRIFLLNNYSLFLGLLSILGASIVANFQTLCKLFHQVASRLIVTALLQVDDFIWYSKLYTSSIKPETKVEIAHDVGAGLFFVLGNVYAWLQVSMSYKMKRFGILSSCVCTMRTVVSVLSTLSLFVFIIMKFYSQHLWDGNELFWYHNDPGYAAHVVGNVFEWFLVFNFLILILTFTKELSPYRLEIKIVGYRDGYEPIPVST